MNSIDNRSSPGRRTLKVAILVLVAITTLGYAARNLILGKPVDVYEATRGDLMQTVVASGRIMTPQRVSIGAVITERVARIPVQEGQAVHRGEILVELDATDARAAVAQTQASVAQAEAKLRQLSEVALPAAEQGFAQAQANSVQARQAYERTRTLQERGFIGQAQLDDARRNLDVAESQLRAARLQVQTNGPAGSDFALAQTALEQARANLRSAQAKLDQTVIHAPVEGVLIARSVEAGNVVQAGKELMVLAPAGETQVVVEIDERNLAQLALSQKALGSADAFPGQRFSAELVYINPGIDAQRGSVEVKLKIANPPPYLRQDMTASVDIEVARRADTLIVPTETVRDATGQHPWVLVIRGWRAERQPVKLGLRGDARIEVLDGVDPGDELIPATNGLVKPGQRVRGIVASAPAGGAR